MNSAIDKALAHEFSETHSEGLAALKTLLAEWQAKPAQQKRLSEFCLELRNIECSAGFHGFTILESLCQRGSVLLDRVMREECAATDKVMSFLSSLLTLMQKALDVIQHEFLERDIDLSELEKHCAQIEFDATTRQQAELQQETDHAESDAEGLVELNAISTVSDIKALYEKINQHIENDVGISIDAAAVEKVDASVLQLLAAYNIDAQHHARSPVNCKMPSTAFVQAVKCLDLEACLLPS